MKKYRAVAYMRLSKINDRYGESDSITNQKDYIEYFVKNNPDIELISQRVDDGYSGIFFRRPSFLEMMADIERGLINCVICKDLSRFGREYIETGRYLKQIFPAYGVRFIAITDGIDTLNNFEGDNLIMSVKSIMNEDVSRDISVKVRNALSVKRKNGDYVGACPVYGYRKSESNHNQLEVDNNTVNTVRDIFKLKIDGMSAAKIADTLNQENILSPIA